MVAPNDRVNDDLHDEIIEEIRAVRRAHAAAFGGSRAPARRPSPSSTCSCLASSNERLPAAGLSVVAANREEIMFALQPIGAPKPRCGHDGARTWR